MIPVSWWKEKFTFISFPENLVVNYVDKVIIEIIAEIKFI